MATLSASSYVVLGLLDQYGAATPYALDRMIRESVGHFWVFPRSQLYAEAARLVRLGLVAEQREDTGRRRRLLSVTPQGRAAFGAWLASPSTEQTEIREYGLLRLFFHPETGADTPEIRKLAAEQADVHRRQLAVYAAIATTRALRPITPQAAALELGMRFERMCITYWDDIAYRGAGAVTTGWAP